MTNDPPDLSHPCPECPFGALLPEHSQCPNPHCVAHQGNRLEVEGRASAVWADGEAVLPLLPVVRRYRAERFSTTTQRYGWAWRRE